MIAAKPTSVPLSAVLGLLLCASTSAGQSNPNTTPPPAALPEKIELAGWITAARPLGDLEENAISLQNSAAAANEKGASLLLSIRANTQFLRDRWSHSAEHRKLPKAYLESLQLDADILGSLPARKPTDRETNAILQDVAEDLEIKVSHCKASAKGWASVITVSVNTVKQGNTIAGLEVWYVPKGWADVPDRWVRCSKLSSPAVAGQLPPGNYMLRVARGQPVPVRVGGNGKDEQSVDLLVP